MSTLLSSPNSCSNNCSALEELQQRLGVQSDRPIREILQACFKVISRDNADMKLEWLYLKRCSCHKPNLVGSPEFLSPDNTPQLAGLTREDRVIVWKIAPRKAVIPQAGESSFECQSTDSESDRSFSATKPTMNRS